MAEESKDKLAGKYALITGGNSGLGKETARCLASVGVHVGITARDPAKGEAAVEEIKKKFPEADVSAFQLDLADLASVRACADAYLATGQRLDLLICNAGVMNTPNWKTKDGFEMVH